jgi:NitT/TauT family transport system ATP-binding protein
MENPLLFFDCVSMRYHDDSGETEVLSDFSLQVNSGEFIALLGPSGCGKSTVLSLAAGLLTPDSGHVYLRGQEIKRPPLHMGYMLQHDHLFPWLTVRDNALVGIRVRQKPTAQQVAYVDSLLAACGLSDFADALPAQLSGGMRQRAALVRTLSVEPDFLLLDEPFSALDAQTRIQLSDEVKQQLSGGDRATILVTHDVYCDR